MRLLITTDAVGGVWRYTMELAAGLRELGVEVRVVSLGPPPSAAQRQEAGPDLCITDLALDWLADTPGELLRSAEGVVRLARAWNADAIHLHLPALASLASWSAPVVAVAHSCVGTWWRAVRGGALPPDLAWRAALVREGLLAADTVLAPSRSFAAMLEDAYGLPRTVQPVWNGRRALPCPRLPRDGVLTAGRLWDEAKNVGILDEVAGRGVPIRAAGALAGPHGPALSLRHVRHLGSLDEARLAREYASAEVFVSTAIYEPFGLSVLEAAQAGCALALSDIPTFRELWDGAALFMPPGDSGAVARCIESARERAAELGEAARHRASRYAREAMTCATLRVHRARELA